MFSVGTFSFIAEGTTGSLNRERRQPREIPAEDPNRREFFYFFGLHGLGSAWMGLDQLGLAEIFSGGVWSDWVGLGQFGFHRKRFGGRRPPAEPASSSTSPPPAAVGTGCERGREVESRRSLLARSLVVQ